MTNSAEPDQLASEPTDLDLHCLQRQGISGFSRTWVKRMLFESIVYNRAIVYKCQNFKCSCINDQYNQTTH